MRDPVFYRVHAYVNDIFILHKDKLTPYTTQQLTFPGVNITSLQTTQASGRANSLNTHWQQSDINMTRGLVTRDFGYDPDSKLFKLTGSISNLVEMSLLDSLILCMFLTLSQ